MYRVITASQNESKIKLKYPNEAIPEILQNNSYVFAVEPGNADWGYDFLGLVNQYNGIKVSYSKINPVTGRPGNETIMYAVYDPSIVDDLKDDLKNSKIVINYIGRPIKLNWEDVYDISVYTYDIPRFRKVRYHQIKYGR